MVNVFGGEVAIHKSVTQKNLIDQNGTTYDETRRDDVGMPSLLSGIGRFLTGTKPWRDAALRQRRDATSKHNDPLQDCATYYQCAICLEMACEPAVTKCG